MTVAFENLGRLLACGPAILYACRAHGDFGATYVSENVQTQLGYTPEQFTTQYDFWLQHIHPQDRDRVVEDLAGIFEHDSHVHEYRFLHADGTYRWMRDELGLIRNEQGEPDTIFGFWTDITERKQVEEEARNSAIRLNAIFTNALDGIVTVTEQGCIESINPAGEEIFGYTQAELIGMPMGLLMTESFRAQYQHYLASYLKTNIPRVIGTVQEIEGLRKGGAVMPIEVSLGEMKLGSERRFIAVVRDISERKKLDRMKNEFISVVSHELRTPLTAIRGSLGLLQGQFADQIPTSLQPLVNIANSNSLRLASLVDDLLDMEKMLSGHMSVNREVIDVQPLVEQALANNQPMADQFKVRLRLHSCVPGRVLADHGRLLQALTNLLSNAAKFSPPDSEVLVDVVAQDGKLRFSVEDHGEGVPAAFQDRIFEKFVQVDASSQRQRGGTGLGLSITKALVETMGGSIGLRSKPGQGSVFYFELPEHC